LAAALIASAWPTAHATEIIRTTGAPMVIEVNEGSLVRIDEPAAAVFVANPEIADVAVKSPRLIYVLGKSPGETTLYAVDGDEKVLLASKLMVTHNLSRLQGALGELLPAASVSAQSIEGGVVLTGDVGTPVEAEDARRLAARFVGDGADVISRLRITQPNQVTLRVRIAEVSRSTARQLGISWAIAGDPAGINFGLVTRRFPGLDATFGGNQLGDLLGLNFDIGAFDFNALVDTLAEQQLINMLAEPNLTALSGETASFLAGGEFPIPVPTDDGIAIEFKKFGVGLSFTPTLLTGNRISMRVRPEVSALTDVGAVVESGIEIPALTVRRAETTVELGSGQTFAIAGLIQSDSQHFLSKLPGLGDIPILGELFKSDSFERGETELIILVTPYIVEPISDPASVALPNDAATGPEGSQKLSLGPSATGDAGASGLIGPVGFVVE
jgi:pilus assembly protein CpaC